MSRAHLHKHLHTRPRRFEAITQDHNACAVKKAKKDAPSAGEITPRFACVICLDDCLVRAPSGLRILAPCGHGFCAACVGVLTGLPGAGTFDCPTCRAPVTSVVTPFF